MTKKMIEYKWSDYEGYVQWSRVFKTWKWGFNSLSNDYIVEHSHIDLVFDTPKDAEDDMFYEIEKRVGVLPKRKC